MIELNFPNEVQREQDFYGRRLERERVEHTLLSGTRRPIIILGERRIGKTSLLMVTVRRLAETTAGRYVPLFLPPASAIHRFTDYARELLQRFCSSLRRNPRETGLIDAQGRFHLPSFGEFTEVLAHLMEDSPGKTFIVCIDELDAILSNFKKAGAGETEEIKNVLGLTDQLLVGGSGLPVVIVSTMARLPEPLSSFYPLLASTADIIPLEPLSQEETDEMITGLLGEVVRLETTARARLFALSGGHPYFVKLLLDRVLARYWRAVPLTVSAEMVESIVIDAVRDPRAQHSVDNIYQVHFNDPEQTVILLLAERPGRGVTQTELGILGTEYKTAARHLAQRGYLKVQNGERYDFRIGFLGYWLRDWDAFEEALAKVEEERSRLDVEIKVYEARREVVVKGRPVKLAPQEYLVLVYLCRSAGRLVTKDQLADALWPNAAGDTGDGSIDSVLHRLRQRLGDDARSQRYIRTVAGQGVILQRAALVVDDFDS